MDERTVLIPFYFAATADADGVWLQEAPQDLDIVGVFYTLHTVTGSPTGANIDIQDDGADAITAIALSAFTAGSTASWKTPHLGGSQTPVHVAAGSDLEIDLNLSGGTSPTAGLNGFLVCLLGAKG